MKDIKFKVEGITCKSCVKLVTDYFKEVPGVHEVTIDAVTGATQVTGEDNLTQDDLAKSLVDTHYSIVL